MHQRKRIIMYAKFIVFNLAFKANDWRNREYLRTGFAAEKSEVRSTRGISTSIWIITCTTTCQIIQNLRRTQTCMRAEMDECAHSRWVHGGVGIRARPLVRACVHAFAPVSTSKNVDQGWQAARHVFAVAVVLDSSFIIARLDIVPVTRRDSRNSRRFTMRSTVSNISSSYRRRI